MFFFWTINDPFIIIIIIIIITIHVRKVYWQSSSLLLKQNEKRHFDDHIIIAIDEITAMKNRLVTAVKRHYERETNVTCPVTKQCKFKVHSLHLFTSKKLRVDIFKVRQRGGRITVPIYVTLRIYKYRYEKMDRDHLSILYHITNQFTYRNQHFYFTPQAKRRDMLMT